MEYTFLLPDSVTGGHKMKKKFSRILDGATRMTLIRALKWAPTWLVSADTSTFISHPDLIQRLAIKGIWYVSPDLSSGGSFRSSHLGHSHDTLENNWKVFLHFEFLCRTVKSIHFDQNLHSQTPHELENSKDTLLWNTVLFASKKFLPHCK